jgi:hypothetical protein
MTRRTSLLLSPIGFFKQMRQNWFERHLAGFDTSNNIKAGFKGEKKAAENNRGLIGNVV